MKQRITAQQFEKLSRNGQQWIKDWVHGRMDRKAKEQHPYSYVTVRPLRQDDWLLTIGDMIEFLVEAQDGDWRDMHIEILHNRWEVSTCYDEEWVFGDDAERGELCDALFAAVKEVLNNE